MKKHLMQLEAVMMLQGIAYGAPPDPPIEQVKVNPKDRYKRRDKATQSFRRGGRG